MKFQDFLEENYRDPALLRAAFIKRAEMMALNPAAKSKEIAVEVALAAKAMIGLMQLKVDSQWTAMVKATRPWSRKNLLKTEKEWKLSRILEMEAQAHEEVERVSANW